MNATTIHITTKEALEREAQRRGIGVHGPVPPQCIIPMVESAIREHNERQRGLTEPSADYTKWKTIMDDLQQFLAVLKTLPPDLPYEKQTPATVPGNAPPIRQKFQQLNKEIDEHLSSLPPSILQQLTGGDNASTNPSNTRQSPVPNPSPDPSNPTPIDSSEDKIARERAEYLAQLLRESVAGKSPIDDLSAERQKALYELTESLPLTVVVKMIAAPEPVGWNFQTTDKSLRRFHDRYEKSLAIAEHAAALIEARTLIQQTGDDEQALAEATRRLIKIRLYKIAATPGGSVNLMDTYTRILDRQHRADIAERRVKLAEKKADQEGEAMKAQAPATHIAGDEIALVSEGKTPKGGTCALDGDAESRASQEEANPKLGGPADPNSERLLEAVRVVEGILNRGGDPGERILEARGLLAEEIRKR